MRIGLSLPRQDEHGNYLTAQQIAVRAKMVEDAGIDGIWFGEHIGLPGDLARDSADNILYLTVASCATSQIELGTSIYCAPLHNKYAIAQRFATLQALAPGRWTFGLGTGSQRKEYKAAGLDWSRRFTLLQEAKQVIEDAFAGRSAETGGLIDEDLWETAHWNQGFDGSQYIPKPKVTMAMEVGRPRLALGAWASPIQLKQAATEYDGWITSGGPGSTQGGWRKVFREGIKRYRDLGGQRAMVTTIRIDLKVKTVPMPEDGGFILACDPATAAERLAMLAEMGFDDVIVRPVDSARYGNSQRVFDFTEEDAALYRSLVPRDTRGYRQTGTPA